MLATATTADARNNLLGFKYPPPTTGRPVVHVYKKIRSAKSTSASPMSGRGISASADTDKTSERALKRKSPLSESRDPSKAPRSKKQSARSTPELGNNFKRSRSARLGSRRHSREPADYLYTPPPKRARSDQPFGSKEKPVPRSCSSEHDGRVDQYTSDHVVRSLLATYKACT
jgi:hypothetical protein